MRSLLALVVLLLASSGVACAQDPGPEPDPVGRILRAAERFGDASSDQGEIALALWAWRLERGGDARALVVEAEQEAVGDARALLRALIDPPALPALELPERLGTLLDAEPDESVLARATRSARFTRGLDRVGLQAALQDLDEGHPWVADVRVRSSRMAPILERVGALIAAVELPVDPARAERVTLSTGEREPAEVPELDDPADAGWVLSRQAGRAIVLDDRLQRREVPLEATSPRDVDAELLRWALLPDPAHWSYRRARQDQMALALRVGWALARGRTWTAVRVAERMGLPNVDPEVGFRWSEVALELARPLQEAALLELSAGRPRSDVVSGLRRAVRVLGAFPAPADLGDAPWSNSPQLRDRLLDLARQLEDQEAELRRLPPVPAYAQWERMTHAERIPYLIRALPDCDGDPTDLLGFGGRSVMRATQRIPADAPLREVKFRFDWGGRRGSGWSAADGLEEAGEDAIPALIAAMSSLAPTRCITMDEDTPGPPMTVGECAADILRTIMDLEDVYDTFYSDWAELPDHAEDPAAYPRALQARARAWWAEAGPRGGLVPLHLARVVAAERVLVSLPPDALEGRSGGVFDGSPSGDLAAGAFSQRRHHTKWLLRRGGGREVEALGSLVLAASAPERRAEWLELLGAAPHEAFDTLLAAELESEHPVVALAGASALLERGDRSGVPRALEIAADAQSDEDHVKRALYLLARAEEPDLGALALDVVIRRPGCDGALAWAFAEEMPFPAERLLVLSRIAARGGTSRSSDPSAREPAQLAVAALQPALRGTASLDDASVRRRVVGAALAEALRLRADPEALEHAAVSAAFLGGEALRALAVNTTADLRSALVDALTHEDSARRATATSALEQLELGALRWLSEGRAELPQALTAALARAARRVR